MHYKRVASTLFMNVQNVITSPSFKSTITVLAGMNLQSTLNCKFVNVSCGQDMLCRHMFSQNIEVQRKPKFQLYDHLAGMHRLSKYDMQTQLLSPTVRLTDGAGHLGHEEHLVHLSAHVLQAHHHRIVPWISVLVPCFV